MSQLREWHEVPFRTLMPSRLSPTDTKVIKVSKGHLMQFKSLKTPCPKGPYLFLPFEIFIFSFLVMKMFLLCIEDILQRIGLTVGRKNHWKGVKGGGKILPYHWATITKSWSVSSLVIAYTWPSFGTFERQGWLRGEVILVAIDGVYIQYNVQWVSQEKTKRGTERRDSRLEYLLEVHWNSDITWSGWILNMEVSFVCSLYYVLSSRHTSQPSPPLLHFTLGY